MNLMSAPTFLATFPKNFCQTPSRTTHFCPTTSREGNSSERGYRP